MNFELPEESRNNILKAANLIKKGYGKWSKLSPKTRNISAGAAFLFGGLLLPKLVFVGAVSSAFLGKHLYLNGEVEEAAREIIVEDADQCEAA